MVDRFGRLIAEHTGIIILEAMLLPTSCGPATFMQHKLDKKLTLGRCTGFTKNPCSLDWVLLNEKGQISG